MAETQAKETQLREEFNRWAETGRGEGMEDGHRNVTEQIIEMMDLGPADRVLDLGCGVGWATRLMAARLPEGEATGVDVADEMIARARAHSEGIRNISFHNASATRLPFDEEYFDKALSVESLYYYPDIPAALREVYRVMRTGGRVFFMLNLFRENEGSIHWAEKLAVPVHVLGEADYRDLFEKAGFQRVAVSRVYDTRPHEELMIPTSFDTLEHIKKALEAGSLLITGER